MRYEPIIGLEIHTELKTRTKMFCYSLNDPDEKHPNMNICPICMGHPGTLPVINEEAVKKVIMVGLVLGGTIAEFSQFDRKNYFYPDLPKGYQISQYPYPFVSGGHLEVLGRTIRITRVHLEEDTGRLIHDTEGGFSLVDFNRAGVPLMELVTEPDLRSGDEVKKFGEELQKIVRYIGASDADMEKGQMRVEVNISLRPEGEEQFGTKVEIKNINSFKFASDAVAYEIRRQEELLASGGAVAHETRGWNEFQHVTFSQRSKEQAHDYRYFPEPDLPPLHISREFVEELRVALPELPQEKKVRFRNEYGIDENMIEVLIRERTLADFFEEVVSEGVQHEKEKGGAGTTDISKISQTVAAVLTGDFLRLLHKGSATLADIRVSAENLAELIGYSLENKISHLVVRQVLEEMVRSGEDPSDIIDRMGLWQISDSSDLESIARHIIEENPKPVGDYKKGKEVSLQFLVGQVMRESHGAANPKVVGEILKKLLE